MDPSIAQPKVLNFDADFHSGWEQDEMVPLVSSMPNWYSVLLVLDGH